MSERPDLEASLAEMDRKLRELQRELELVAGQGARGDAPTSPGSPTGSARSVGGSSTATGASPRPVRPVSADPVGDAVEEAVARVSELGRRIDDLAALRDELDSATRALREEYSAARPAPARRDVVVDAGPFPDIATLSAFEQALAGVEGVEDAAVRSFEGNRALIDVRARADADLEAALARLPFPAEVTQAQGDALTLHLRSGA
ncbi:MAG: hypothetical protein M3141_00945 [Actinomycetota bacterium]|nr:hypothetical protein [Actinomycetota bacterium]